MKKVMTLVTEYNAPTDRICVYQRYNDRPENQRSMASFQYDHAEDKLTNHHHAALRWLELKGSGRHLCPYAHEVNDGYYFGMF